MVTTQTFRLLGKPGTKDITCGLVDGESVVFWEDIEQVFPGVKYIANGNTVISLMRDSNRERIIPHCIKHYPGVVLDVALSPITGDNPSKSTAEIPGVSSDEQPSGSTMDLEQEIVQRLASVLPPELQAQLRSTSDGYDFIAQAIKDGKADPLDIVGKCLQELMKLSDRVIQQQIRKQQTSLQDHVEALMMRPYELHENPTPRLFVVLPQDTSSWNSADLFSNKFRLFFLCECGEHTESTNSKISHHTHFTKHGGYEIIHPEEFFRRYGSYVLVTLKILKARVSEAGIIMPTLSHLVQAGASNTVTASLEKLISMERMMDQIISHIEKASLSEDKVSDQLMGQTGNETIASTDLSSLGLFLRNNRSKALGDLYRTVNVKGHVKWVCIDHYREMYQEKAVKTFRDTVKSLGGSFDENLGHVEVTLCSRDQADEFHLALEEANFIFALEIGLLWSTTHGDLKRMRDTLLQTNVGVLVLDLNYTGDPESDFSDHDHDHRHDPIFDVMRHPSIKSVTIARPPQDFIDQSSLLSRSDTFANLRHLAVDLWKLSPDSSSLKVLISKAPNLVHLVLGRDSGRFLSVYSTIAELQTYPITFSDQPLRILPPTDDMLPPMTDIEDMADFLTLLGGRIEKVEFSGKDLDGPTIAAFSKATASRSRLKELILRGVGRDLGRSCIKDIASIVHRSELRKLDIDLENEQGRVRILESVPWEHIRDLSIRMDEESQGMDPLKAVVDGLRMSERVDMRRLEVRYETPRRVLPMAQELLLRSCVAAMSLMQLQLDVTMNSKQLLGLLDLVDFSRLRYLTLSCEDYKSSELDAVVIKLQQATELRILTLLRAKPTKWQTERMKAQGAVISLMISPCCQ